MRFVIRSIVLVLLSVVVGCAGHKPKVPMPGESAGPAEWEEYYVDQFKALGDKVQPPSEQAPLEQRVAYQDVKRSFESGRTVVTILSVLLAGVSLLLLTSALSQASSL